jgi:hypothetical protein
MGSAFGCTNISCFKNTTKDISIDIFKKNNLDNLYTVNSTGKNEKEIQEEKEELDEIKEINNEKDYIEKEEIKENIQEENQNISNSSEIKSETDNDKEKKEEKNKEQKNEPENNNNNIKKENESDRDSLTIEDNIYERNIDKIKLIQKNYRNYKERLKIKKQQMQNKKRQNNHFMARSKKMSKTMSINKKKDNKFKKNGGKNDLEEIISIDDSRLIFKNSSKLALANNFKVAELDQVKNSMILPNNKNNLFKINGDIGEKLSFIKTSNNINKKLKLTQISLSKNKREILTKKTKDNIKGNFIQKNEKVIRYQGGFLKKTRKKNGFGIITWSDNSKLKGIFESNDINGICRFYNHKYKSTFIGEYVNSHPKGFGVYNVKSFSLQGYWESEILNGIAIEVWEDGTYFQGEYKDNKKNGIGLYRWPDGTIYQGEFKDGQMNGLGIILYSNDCIFSGEIENGYMNGYGTYSWGNGCMYMGNYTQDIKNGFGIYIWDQKNFLCYIGFWEMGKQQGIGAKINGNKIKYCIWNKGKISATLKGLYEIDKYLTGIQKGYYQYFTPSYISKLKLTNFFNLNEK